MISWGYHPVYDYTVMTVLSETLRENAWSGWNYVSSAMSFQDVGTNLVSQIDTL
jgi:hypothetical protein